MKTVKSTGAAKSYALALLAVVLAVLFWKSFLPGYVHFANDGPLGQQNAAWLRLPEYITGSWFDLNSIGSSAGVVSPSINTIIRWVLGPVDYSKFLAPVTLWILGAGAWFFFRQLKLSPLAATLGGLAAALNSDFFSTACWGVASQQIAIGMDFFALGLVAGNSPGTPALTRWTRLALAGLCVGMNVMEALDIGAFFSLCIAAFAFYKAVIETDGSVVVRIGRGTARVMVIAAFAGFIAVQTVASLVSTQIQGVAGTAQDSETKAAHWDWATQWSQPKIETLGLLVPGLFGYRMDTPKDMMTSSLQDHYKGGEYWGGIGRDPAIDRYFDSGRQGEQPPGFMRFVGSGDYLGILVALLAAFAIAQSLRRENCPFTETQKKFIWFWAVVLAGSLLMSWGRFAPVFYKLFYALPYASTIRNPTKFTLILSWAAVILFGYGVHALSRRYLEVPAGKSNSFSLQLLNWWPKAGHFERKWTFSCLGVLGASVAAWFIYASEKPALMRYLQARGFSDEDTAQQIITFSVGQAGWWLVIFAAALALLALVMAGCFAGSRAKWGGLLLGGFLVLDLGRADLPFIIHWDYKQKYEIGTLNPVEDFLRDKPYEHRVAILPFDTQSQMRDYDNSFGGLGIYRIEWAQHHFPYYNIQSFDIIQMSRMPEDLKSYLNTFSPRDTPETVPLIARQWQLTNTRYLLGPAGFLEVMNQQLDPVQHRFRIAQRFDIVAKPGITQPTQPEELTAMSASDGDLALFEFTGALPRAKLYSNWLVNTNNQSVLKTLGDLNFDPAKTVLISTPQKDLPAVATNENAGTVEFTSYAPKQIVFAANAPAPSVLLLNDKFDPDWRVTVDGKPAELLRCNYIMRGVYLPAGPHTVVFRFNLLGKTLYVTIAAIVIGIFLIGLLIFLQRAKPATQP